MGNILTYGKKNTGWTKNINGGFIPLRCASRAAYNTRALPLAHLHGMQPWLMLFITPVVAKSKCLPWDRSITECSSRHDRDWSLNARCGIYRKNNNLRMKQSADHKYSPNQVFIFFIFFIHLFGQLIIIENWLLRSKLCLEYTIRFLILASSNQIQYVRITINAWWPVFKKKKKVFSSYYSFANDGPNPHVFVLNRLPSSFSLFSDWRWEGKLYILVCATKQKGQKVPKVVTTQSRGLISENKYGCTIIKCNVQLLHVS